MNQPPNYTKIICITTVDISLRFLLLNSLLDLKGSNFDVIGVCAPGEYIEDIKLRGVRVLTVPMTRRITPLQDIISLIKLIILLRNEKPHIVHTHTPKANLLGQIAAKLVGVPVRISTVHGFYFTEHTPFMKRLLFQIIEAVSAFFTHLVLMINQEDVKTAELFRICPTSKIKLLNGGIGIDTKRFDRSVLTTQFLESKKKELRIPPEHLVIGFVGRLVVEKGLIELFQAYSIISKRYPNTHLLIVGPVDHEKPDAVSPHTAENYNIAEKITFTGMRTDLPELYAIMDVSVLPSHREGFGIVLAEASAMKVPVVATDIRGCREAVEHEQNGLLVPLGDVPALADSIERILTNPELAKQMGSAGRQMAEERFDERLVFERVKAEYARLLHEKGLPVPATVATEQVQFS